MKASVMIPQQTGQLQQQQQQQQPFRGDSQVVIRQRSFVVRPSARAGGCCRPVSACCASGSTAVATSPNNARLDVDESCVTWRDDFAEKFSVGDEIGRGCQGVVRRVVSRESGRLYAAKTVPKKTDRGSESRRTRSEARLMAAAQGCGGVVGMEGAYEDEESVTVVMELLEGGTLEEWMQQRRRRRMEEVEAEVAQVMKQVLSFLEYCHGKGICYGDVKPANFMVQEGGQQGLAVKAIDFGCSQKVVPGVRLRAPAGSPLYMAPEVFLGSYGLEVDIWAAGVMMFQLLCGKAPFAEYDDYGEIVDVGIHVGYSYDGYPWDNISNEAKELIDSLLTRAARKRASAKEALKHPWFAKHTQPSGGEETRGQELSSIVAAPELLHSVAV